MYWVRWKYLNYTTVTNIKLLWVLNNFHFLGLPRFCLKKKIKKNKKKATEYSKTRKPNPMIKKAIFLKNIWVCFGHHQPTKSSRWVTNSAPWLRITLCRSGSSDDSDPGCSQIYAPGPLTQSKHTYDFTVGPETPIKLSINTTTLPPAGKN